MRHTIGLVFTLSAALALFISGLIVVVRVVFAANGGEVAFESNRDGNWDIYLLDLQTGITHNLTRSAADDMTPAWSPDGSEIAFISDRDNDLRTELYVINADGSHLRRLTTGAKNDRDPFWTGNGRSLVLMHGWQQIFRFNVETGAEQWLGIGFAPHLSPDGNSLLYYTDGNSGPISHVYTLDLHDRRVTDLTAGTTHNWGGTWSPDGSEIAFMSNRSGKSSIYTMNPDGSQLNAITTGYNDSSPAWSSNGRHIVFASGETGAMQLYMIDADGSRRRTITASQGDNHAPAWRPQPR